MKTALVARLEQFGATPSRLYVPLGIGNHVDHQHVGEVGRRFAQEGYEVWAYEDFPYADDPGSHNQAHQITGSEPVVCELTPELLEHRVRAILCYQSQLAVIFRHQGDPAEATRRYATDHETGRPVERFWPMRSATGTGKP